MAEFKGKGKPERPKGEAKSPRIPPVQITDDRCKVCQSRNRSYIEEMIVAGFSAPRICAFMEQTGESFNRQNMHTHRHNHMTMEDAVIGEMWQHHARNALLDPDQMKNLIITRDGMLDVMLEYAKRELQAGNIIWSASDMLKVMDKQKEYESSKSSIKIDAILQEAEAFGDAVRTVIAPSQYKAIVAQFNRNMEIAEAPIEVMAVEVETVEIEQAEDEPNEH